MKLSLISMALLISIIALSGCSTLNNTSLDPNVVTVDYIEIEEDAHRIDNFLRQKKSYSITVNSEEEYIKNFGEDPSKEINFEENTILGFYMSGGGCSVDVQKNVTRNDSKKEIFYKVEFNESGPCDLGFRSLNLIIVPKIPEDYQIFFNPDIPR